MAIQQHDTKLIRLVAGRYRELQGLTTIADTGLLLVYGIFLYWGEEWPAEAIGAMLAALLIARVTVIRSRIGDYYRRRCGRVAARPVLLDPSFMFLMGLLYGALSRTWHVPLPARVAVIIVMMAGEPAWIVIRDWPHRLQWILPLVAGVAAAASLATVGTDEHAFEWQRQFGLLGGLSIAVAGWLDHALLIQTLGTARGPEIAHAEAGPPGP